jgi:hypothetical protein
MTKRKGEGRIIRKSWARGKLREFMEAHYNADGWRISWLERVNGSWAAGVELDCVSDPALSSWFLLVLDEQGRCVNALSFGRGKRTGFVEPKLLSMEGRTHGNA